LTCQLVAGFKVSTEVKRFAEQAGKPRASAEAWHAELGVTDHNDVRTRINAVLDESSEWVLIGGPGVLDRRTVKE
jgi:ATP-dependent exoDNAse (exonuclease V) alpha subunit